MGMAQLGEINISLEAGTRVGQVSIGSPIFHQWFPGQEGVDKLEERPVPVFLYFFEKNFGRWFCSFWMNLLKIR